MTVSAWLVSAFPYVFSRFLQEQWWALILTLLSSLLAHSSTSWCTNTGVTASIQVSPSQFKVLAVSMCETNPLPVNQLLFYWAILQPTVQRSRWNLTARNVLFELRLLWTAVGIITRARSSLFIDVTGNLTQALLISVILDILFSGLNR